MMTTAPDAFSNNDALDFLDIMFGNPNWDVARDAFASVLRFPNKLEYSDGAYALAGAALLANSRTGKPPVPALIAGLIVKLGRPAKEIVVMAREAFPVVVESQTGFAKQHLSPDVLAAWLAYIAELRAALYYGDP